MHVLVCSKDVSEEAASGPHDFQADLQIALSVFVLTNYRRGNEAQFDDLLLLCTSIAQENNYNAVLV